MSPTRTAHRRVRPTRTRHHLLELLESRALLSVAVGSLDLVQNWPTGSPQQVWGWAYDADLGNNGADPATVRLDIDGFPVQSQPASLDRQDLAPVTGSVAHGYRFIVPPLTPGSHTLRVVTFDQPQGTETTLGTRTFTVSPGVLGSVDFFDSANGISGWAYDPIGQGAVSQIRIDVDGAPFTTINAAASRADLVPFLGSANHGFNTAIPTLSPGTHRIDVFAVSITGQQRLLLASNTVAAPGPVVGSLDAANPNLIGGWAFDPDTPAAGTQVRITIDGTPFRTLTTNLTRPDLAQFGAGPYGFQFNTPTLAPGTHTVQMYAFDAPSNALVLIGEATFATAGSGARPPIGSVDLASATAVAGWALDPDDPTSAIQIRIDIDGSTAFLQPAGLNRPDLQAPFNSTNHGFFVSLNALAPGLHNISVFALDSSTNNPILLGSRTISV